MLISVDRSLPISLHIQIVGAIEYGIMAGTFRGGMLLPSVRELSRKLNVSPLTVSGAYRELKENGLIMTEQGRGTFVRLEKLDAAMEQSIVSLRTRFQQLLAEANALGVNSSFFAEMIRQQSDRREPVQQPMKMMLVGNSNRMSSEYARIIQQVLPAGQAIDVCTFEEFEALPPADIEACAFYLTLPHCTARIRSRVGEDVVVLAPYLIPAETTRRSLASLPGASNVLLVSRFRTFLPAMLEGVKAAAPQVGNIDVFSVDEKHLEEKIARCDVLIYSTGCHHLVQNHVNAKPAFEYVHVPEPGYLIDILQPAYFNFKRQAPPASKEEHDVD